MFSSDLNEEVIKYASLEKKKEIQKIKIFKSNFLYLICFFFYQDHFWKKNCYNNIWKKDKAHQYFEGVQIINFFLPKKEEINLN